MLNYVEKLKRKKEVEGEKKHSNKQRRRVSSMSPAQVSCGIGGGSGWGGGTKNTSCAFVMRRGRERGGGQETIYKSGQITMRH